VNTNLDFLIAEILRREGGFVDHPDDRGGATNHGITQDALMQWRGRPVTVEEVHNLTEEEASDIYIARYVIAPGFDGIEHGPLTMLVVDCGVNHGPARASRWLQGAAGVTVDGMVGPVTLEAVNSQDGAVLYRAVLAERSRFYGRLIARDPSQAVFAAGWANRLAEFIEGVAL